MKNFIKIISLLLMAYSIFLLYSTYAIRTTQNTYANLTTQYFSELLDKEQQQQFTYAKQQNVQKQIQNNNVFWLKQNIKIDSIYTRVLQITDTDFNIILKYGILSESQIQSIFKDKQVYGAEDSYKKLYFLNDKFLLITLVTVKDDSDKLYGYILLGRELTGDDLTNLQEVIDQNIGLKYKNIMLISDNKNLINVPQSYTEKSYGEFHILIYYRNIDHINTFVLYEIIILYIILLILLFYVVRSLKFIKNKSKYIDSKQIHKMFYDDKK